MNLHKLIIVLLIAVFAVCGLAEIAIDISYSSFLPDIPDAKTGRTFRMEVNHGFIRYGTERQFHFRETLLKCFPISIAFCFAALLLGLKWGVLHIGKGRKLLE
jgi:hypothetical protein